MDQRPTVNTKSGPEQRSLQTGSTASMPGIGNLAIFDEFDSLNSVGGMAKKSP